MAATVEVIASMEAATPRRIEPQPLCRMNIDLARIALSFDRSIDTLLIHLFGRRNGSIVHCLKRWRPRLLELLPIRVRAGSRFFTLFSMRPANNAPFSVQARPTPVLVPAHEDGILPAQSIVSLIQG